MYVFEKIKILTLPGIRTPEHPAPSLLAMPTAPLWLQAKQ
jgi:hypothetical protein